jgi:hypothetical protein
MFEAVLLRYTMNTWTFNIPLYRTRSCNRVTDKTGTAHGKEPQTTDGFKVHSPWNYELTGNYIANNVNRFPSIQRSTTESQSSSVLEEGNGQILWWLTLEHWDCNEFGSSWLSIPSALDLSVRAACRSLHCFGFRNIPWKREIQTRNFKRPDIQLEGHERCEKNAQLKRISFTRPPSYVIYDLESVCITQNM